MYVVLIICFHIIVDIPWCANPISCGYNHAESNLKYMIKNLFSYHVNTYESKLCAYKLL